MEKSISIARMMPVIEEMLKKGNTVEISPLGKSMRPSIVNGDIVTLRQPTFPVRKYDIVLYKRSVDEIVLHRVVGVKEQGCIMAGDAQQYVEFPVTNEQIVGVVTRITRDGAEIYNAEKRKYFHLLLHDIRLWHSKARLSAGMFYRKHIKK